VLINIQVTVSLAKHLHYCNMAGFWHAGFYVRENAQNCMLLMLACDLGMSGKRGNFFFKICGS